LFREALAKSMLKFSPFLISSDPGLKDATASRIRGRRVMPATRMKNRTRQTEHIFFLDFIL
jgi:hypothetical protein